jgi:hypothetical protein
VPEVATGLGDGWSPLLGAPLLRVRMGVVYEAENPSKIVEGMLQCHYATGEKRFIATRPKRAVLIPTSLAKGRLATRKGNRYLVRPCVTPSTWCTMSNARTLLASMTSGITPAAIKIDAIGPKPGKPVQGTRACLAWVLAGLAPHAHFNDLSSRWPSHALSTLS